jgi:hypothetical protein
MLMYMVLGITGKEKMFDNMFTSSLMLLAAITANGDEHIGEVNFIEATPEEGKDGPCYETFFCIF